MIKQAHELRERAQHCVLLAAVSDDREIGALLTAVAHNLTEAASQIEAEADEPDASASHSRLALLAAFDRFG